MLNYDRIIHRFTLEEKIDLLISVSKGTNQNVEDFKFPSFEINETTEETGRSFSKFSTLATTWNLDLIFKAAVNRGNYLRSLKEPKIIGVPLTVKNATDYEAFSSEQYLIGKFASSYLNGLNETGVYTCYVNFPGYLGNDEIVRRNNLLASEVAIKNSKPDVVVLNSHANVDILNNEIKYEGYKMVETDEYVKAFYNGCNFIFASENPKETMLLAIHNYNKRKADLQNGLITIVEFEDLERQGVIFNPSNLDTLLDEYFEFINNFDANCNCEDYEFTDSAVEAIISNQSIILMKNENVLPLDRTAPTIMIGNWALRNEESVVTPYNHAKTIDLQIKGCAHGYSTDDLDKEKLLEEALNMSGNCTHALVFLSTYYGENKSLLPEDQVEVLKRLHENGKKVIAILNAPGAVVGDFYQYCDGVIQVINKDINTIHSLFKIICGDLCPSGKTTWYTPLSLDVAVDKNDKETYLYPIGHGLSYTVFEYSNITYNELGVQFTLSNKGFYPGYETAMLYVKFTNENGDVILHELRGFEKVYLKSKESKRVTIPFDDYTFRVFNTEHNCYEVISGAYQIFVNSDADYPRLGINLSVRGELLDENGFENVVVEESDQIDEVLTKFQKTLSRKSFFEEIRGLGYGKKMFIGTLVFIYFALLSVFLAVINYMNDQLLEMYIAAAAILLISLTVFIIFAAKAKKKKRVLDSITPNQPLSELIKRMNVYEEVSKVTYPKPIVIEPEEVIEEVVEEEIVEEVDENKKAFIDEGFGEYVEHEKFVNDVALPNYVTTFVDYASHHGLIIEPKSARALLSALGTTHLIILKSMNKELIPNLLSLLCNYLLCNDVPLDMSGVTTHEELFWKEVSEDQYERTEFAKLIYGATQLKNTINLAVLNNVDLINFKEVFGPIAKFINNPNGDFMVNLGIEEKPLEVKLPKNLVYIVVPSDDNYLETIDKDVAEVSLSIELALRKNDIHVDIEDHVSYLSFNGLTELVRINREHHIINEQVWKKIDDFEEEINNLEYFRVENKTILDFEKFVGLMIEEGADMDEAIDALFASRIIPILKSYNIYKKNNGDTEIFDVIDRIFGAENMPMTKRAINKPM